MGLISQISDIITGLYPDATFLLGSKFTANYQSYLVEATALPLIVLDNELTKTAEIKKNLNVQKDTKIVISVFLADSMDNTDTQSQVIQEQAEDIADRIAVNIWQLIEIRPITGNQKYKITPLFRYLNSIMSGVAIEMQGNYNLIIDMTPPDEA
ncbi:MAG: hypothetical protein WC401_03535 [Bacteroidales bacterium]